MSGLPKFYNTRGTSECGRQQAPAERYPRPPPWPPPRPACRARIEVHAYACRLCVGGLESARDLRLLIRGFPLVIHHLLELGICAAIRLLLLALFLIYRRA